MYRHRSPAWRIKLGRRFGQLASLAAVSTPAATGVALLFFGWQWAALVLLVGWLLLVPLFRLLRSFVTPDPADRIVRSIEAVVCAAVEAHLPPERGSHERSERDPSEDPLEDISGDPLEDSSGDPLETLRECYVAGDIDEAAFERRVARVLDPDVEPRAMLEDEDRVGSERDPNCCTIE